MKWAKTKSECDRIRKRWAGVIDKKTLAKDMSYYVEIKDKTTHADLKADGYDVWCKFDELDKHYKTKNGKRRYEMFIGGYLFYFDEHVEESGSVNRTVYFDWGKLNTKADLTLYLKPFYNNPLKTKSTEKASVIKTNGNGNGNGNGHGIGKQSHKQNRNELLMQKALVPPPPADEGIDPPPPPQPPPPPKDEG